MPAPKIPYDVELKAVAMLARGDSQTFIADVLEINKNTVKNIKNRNQETLGYIKKTLVEQEASASADLYLRANKLLGKKLSHAEKAEDRRKELAKQFQNGTINYKEYRKAIRELDDIAVKDLTSISREMFNQSQIEQGKPTSIHSPLEAKQYLKDVAEAIKSGDEIELQRIIFNPKDD